MLFAQNSLKNQVQSTNEKKANDEFLMQNLNDTSDFFLSFFSLIKMMKKKKEDRTKESLNSYELQLKINAMKSN